MLQRGDQLQISAELVNASDKTQMWGEQFNRRVTDALAVQMEISQQIADKLKLRLTNADEQQMVKDAKVNPDAYELLLKGRFYYAKGSQEDLSKAVEYYTQAIAIDSKYALAYERVMELRCIICVHLWPIFLPNSTQIRNCACCCPNTRSSFSTWSMQTVNVSLNGCSG